jgi:hypothetical protein
MEISVNANFRSRGTVRIPAKVLARLELMGEVAKGDEYGMYLSADIDPIRWEAAIDPDVFEIPPQRVSPGSIRMLEVPDDMYENKWGERCFNTVVHRHPGSFGQFSQTDFDYINRFFQISFIYLKGFRVPMCIMNRMEAVGEYTTLECNVVVTDGTISLVDNPDFEKDYPLDLHRHHGVDLHGNHGLVDPHPYRGFRPLVPRKIRVLEEYEALKAEILSTEPDMTPEELEKKFVKYGYTPEEMSEIGETQKWITYSGGANGRTK